MAASCFRSPPAPDISSFLLLHPRSRMARVQPHRLRFQCSKRRSLPLMLYFLDLGRGRGAPSSFPSSGMRLCRREPCIYGEAALPSTWSNENGYVYEICNKGFQRDQNLKLHRRGHNLPWKLRGKSIKEAVRKRVYFGPEESCVHHHPSRALGDLTGIKKHFSGSTGRRSGGVRGAPRGILSTLTGKPMSRPVEQGSTDATVESSSLGFMIGACVLCQSLYISQLESGGPRYAVPLGRRDGQSFATQAVTLASLPTPTSNITTLLTVLGRIGLDAFNLVAFYGDHTIGINHLYYPPSTNNTSDNQLIKSWNSYGYCRVCLNCDRLEIRKMRNSTPALSLF